MGSVEVVIDGWHCLHDVTGCPILLHLLDICWYLHWVWLHLLLLKQAWNLCSWPCLSLVLLWCPWSSHNHSWLSMRFYRQDGSLASCQQNLLSYPYTWVKGNLPAWSDMMCEYCTIGRHRWGHFVAMISINTWKAWFQVLKDAIAACLLEYLKDIWLLVLSGKDHIPPPHLVWCYCQEGTQGPHKNNTRSYCKLNE